MGLGAGPMAGSLSRKRAPGNVHSRSAACPIWAGTIVAVPKGRGQVVSGPRAIKILPDRTSSTTPNGRSSEMKLSSFSVSP